MNKKFILKKRKDFVRVAKGVSMVASTVLLQAAPSLSRPNNLTADASSQTDNTSELSASKTSSNTSSNTVQSNCHDGLKADVDYKVGFTTTKKIGKAHIRNRARRRLRAVAREIFPSLALTGTDYVLIARFSTANCPYKQLQKDVKWALKKTNRVLLGEEPAPEVVFHSKKKGGKKQASKLQNNKNSKSSPNIENDRGDNVRKRECRCSVKTGGNCCAFNKLILLPFVAVVKFYQKFLSPFCPGCCRFRPTCSQYMIEALKSHGIIKGLYLGIKRILRCQPWGGSGYDPVPDKPEKKS